MKKGLLFSIFLLVSQQLFARNEIGPEGHKLLWVLLLVVAIALAFIFSSNPFKKKNKTERKPLFQFRRIKIELEKDALYYPDNIKLIVKNTGNTDIDIDQPLFVFDNFWLKRKFRIKGTENRTFYPLYLEKGKTHTLNIDLNRFYGHDKSLKKFPKAKVILSDVKGKKIGSCSVFLFKTLFKY